MVVPPFLKKIFFTNVAGVRWKEQNFILKLLIRSLTDIWFSKTEGFRRKNSARDYFLRGIINFWTPSSVFRSQSFCSAAPHKKDFRSSRGAVKYFIDSFSCLMKYILHHFLGCFRFHQ